MVQSEVGDYEGPSEEEAHEKTTQDGNENGSHAGSHEGEGDEKHEGEGESKDTSPKHAAALDIEYLRNFPIVTGQDDELLYKIAEQHRAHKGLPSPSPPLPVSVSASILSSALIASRLNRRWI